MNYKKLCSVFLLTCRIDISKQQNTTISALNFSILKTNLSKIASKEVKIYTFKNYFLKKGVVQQLLLLAVRCYFHYILSP